jgi:hypothetical protein
MKMTPNNRRLQNSNTAQTLIIPKIMTPPLPTIIPKPTFTS